MTWFQIAPRAGKLEISTIRSLYRIQISQYGLLLSLEIDGQQNFRFAVAEGDNFSKNPPIRIDRFERLCIVRSFQLPRVGITLQNRP